MSELDQTGQAKAPTRPGYRVPIGMPVRGDGRKGLVVSILVHGIILLLIIFNVVVVRTVIEKIEQGSGGAGPAGGGGGGRLGDDGTRERLQYVRVVPHQVPTPTQLPPVPTPVVPKIIPPEVKAPTPSVQTPEAPAPMMSISSVPGIGSGRDGTAGNGPGSGGGVGSGIGTGRGSGVGPGTGGGTQANYPPQPIEFFLPPLPPPSSVKGFHFIAEFDVDSTGKVLDFRFSDTPDGDYNRRIRSILRSMRFRPGVGPDGKPLRMKAQVGYEF